MGQQRYASHFTLWQEEAPYDDHWVITDTRDDQRPVEERSGRLLTTRDEGFARRMVETMRTTSGWWD